MYSFIEVNWEGNRKEEQLDDAEHFSNNEFGISEGDWIYIDEPVEGAQHDLINN